jgi:hypothetical protein
MKYRCRFCPLPVAAVHDLVEGPPLGSVDRRERPVCRVTQREQQHPVPVLGQPEHPAGKVGVGHSGMTAADAKVGSRQQAEHDRLVSHLQNLIPMAMPEIIAVRIPDTDRLVIVLRVNADAVAHPVLVNGRVLYRSRTVGSRRSAEGV